MENAAPVEQTALQMIKQYFLDFSVLKDNPREYWGVQTVNFLDSIAYFAFFNMVSVFLTQNMGWDDVNAGYIFTAFSMLVTISLMVGGFITDSLGIRKALYLAMGLSLVARGGIAACGLFTDLPGRMWIVIAFFLIASPGMAMTQTIFQAANRRFSTRRSRSASFNAWYLIMNIGAATAGYSIDFIRLKLGADNSWIYAFAAATSIISIAVTFFTVRREQQTVGDGEGEAAEAEAPEGEKMGFVKRLTVLGHQESFWRFIVLMVSVLGVRAVFLYFGMLMPKYWLRVVGPEAPIGMLQTINPIIIVVGVILMIPIANRFNAFKMLVVGATVSSISLLVLVMPWSWYGGDMASGYVNMSIVMSVVLSFGELLWSPKLNEYTAAIAPKGQEGAYLGMSMMPWFFAKFIVSFASGHMLARWCPEGIAPLIAAGELSFWQRPEAMWFVLFIWAISGPALAWLLSGWLTKGTDLDPPKRKAVAKA